MQFRIFTKAIKETESKWKFAALVAYQNKRFTSGILYIFE